MSSWNQEQEYQAGARAERDRIIKIIKPFTECPECAAGERADDCSPEMAKFLIGLIEKSENV